MNLPNESDILASVLNIDKRKEEIKKAKEIIQALMKFRWMWISMNKAKCNSCGALVSINHETNEVTKIGRVCSNTCPWEVAQKYLDENK